MDTKKRAICPGELEQLSSVRFVAGHDLSRLDRFCPWTGTWSICLAHVQGLYIDYFRMCKMSPLCEDFEEHNEKTERTRNLSRKHWSGPGTWRRPWRPPEQKHATTSNKMITSATQTRKEETTVERWMKTLALFCSDSLAMNGSALRDPTVASCRVVATTLPRPQMSLFCLDCN